MKKVTVCLYLDEDLKKYLEKKAKESSKKLDNVKAKALSKTKTFAKTQAEEQIINGFLK